MKFARQHAIITGGSSGIGKATAKLLASKGANISIIARDRAKLEAAKLEIEAAKINSKQQIFSVEADVAQRSQIEQAIQTCIATVGTPDILITSAGIASPGYFQEVPIEVFERTMAINYFGSLYSIKAVLPSMEKQQKGQVVLISSGAGLIGIYGYTPYSPSKFALRGLAESLRGELKPLGIQISIVYPPDTDTPQLEIENKSKPLETKLITGTAQTWSAQAVAREILKGIETKKFAIAPGSEMAILGRFHSLIAPGLNWYFDRIVAKVKNSNLRQFIKKD
ncbi:MAG: SDR family oxidoreductase [Hydrococcus sp. C42_A2020_068]|uniref:SDR family oxidoreductase n=1 Tax=Pleurocapsa sp. PCC 7327 TaxID=118163 RepID=UPI00059D4581|nr:SDR family oxidoreductase [Pleurocapsa sp. PCC 7327]MBF2018694.1 SDR family oxidoreductase [Hydrococcus sp. C42_A2020_068]